VNQAPEWSVQTAAARATTSPPRVLWWCRFLARAALAVATATLPCAAGNPPGSPTNLMARAGDMSVSLHWDPPTEAPPFVYRVYRSDSPDSAFIPLNAATAPVHLTGFADVQATNGVTWYYRVTALNAAGEGAPSAVIAATPKPFASDAEFLELLQAAAFDFFWHEANPTNGLIKDRSTTNSFASIASVGFGLTGIGIGIDHGWITRAQGRSRTLATLQTFWQTPQGDQGAGTIGTRGWFYHFLDMNRATRYQSVELSSIDTALLLAGVVYAREYFDGVDPDEQAIRDLADALVNRVDWTWMLNGHQTFSMGWIPESKFITSQWIGYNEGMILYVLALGSTNSPPPTNAWTAWTAGYQWRTNYGYSYVQFPPLFGHQYSHSWVDFRYVTDTYLSAKGISYFENSRRATLAQYAYCVANPGRHRGYSTNVWGITACDGPPATGYLARGAPPPQNDDGTLAPTAVGGSLPFTPDIGVATLRHFYDAYRTNIWTGYGFCDAFNPTWNWFDADVLGIDQGPILLMAENYRTQRVWRTMMKSPIIQRGLTRAGFQPLSFAAPALRYDATNANAALKWPAPANASFQVEFSPDLDAWFVSPTGFFLNTNTPTLLSWTDTGPPATDASPASAPQRFYRVLQVGAP